MAPAKKESTKAPAKDKGPAMDYSGLEKGMRLQAEVDGVYYAAEVCSVNTRRGKAPVKVHFCGYTDDHDEWLGADRLRSKAITPKEEGSKGKNEEAGKKGDAKEGKKTVWKKKLDLTDQAFYKGLGPRPCLEKGESGVRPWRFPLKDLPTLNPDLANMLMTNSGVSVCFDTEARGFSFRFKLGGLDSDPFPTMRKFPAKSPGFTPGATLHMHELAVFDLFVDGKFFARKTNDPQVKGCSLNMMMHHPSLVGEAAKKPVTAFFGLLMAGIGAGLGQVMAIPEAERDL